MVTHRVRMTPALYAFRCALAAHARSKGTLKRCQRQEACVQEARQLKPLLSILTLSVTIVLIVKELLAIVRNFTHDGSRQLSAQNFGGCGTDSAAVRSESKKGREINIINQFETIKVVHIS